jgi:hypothetical protein
VLMFSFMYVSIFLQSQSRVFRFSVIGNPL